MAVTGGWMTTLKGGENYGWSAPGTTATVDEAVGALARVALPRTRDEECVVGVLQAPLGSSSRASLEGRMIDRLRVRRMTCRSGVHVAVSWATGRTVVMHPGRRVSGAHLYLLSPTARGAA